MTGKEPCPACGDLVRALRAKLVRQREAWAIHREVSVSYRPPAGSGGGSRHFRAQTHVEELAVGYHDCPLGRCPCWPFLPFAPDHPLPLPKPLRKPRLTLGLWAYGSVPAELREAQWVARYPVNMRAMVPPIIEKWGNLTVWLTGTLVVKGWRPERKRKTEVSWEPREGSSPRGLEAYCDLAPLKVRATFSHSDRPDATLWRVGLELLEVA